MTTLTAQHEVAIEGTSEQVSTLETLVQQLSAVEEENTTTMQKQMEGEAQLACDKTVRELRQQVRLAKRELSLIGGIERTRNVYEVKLSFESKASNHHTT